MPDAGTNCVNPHPSHLQTSRESTEANIVAMFEC
jgi:hypothetical protein